MSEKLRIGVFYDGHFYSDMSHWYKYKGPFRKRLSLKAIPQYLRMRVANLEDARLVDCLVTEQHCFRGRPRITNFNVDEEQALKIAKNQMFDDVLLNEGITIHNHLNTSRGKEKGVDVNLAVTAMESALKGELDVAIFITGDADFVPLLRKLHQQGVTTVVGGWNDSAGAAPQDTTMTSTYLLQNATYGLDLKKEFQELHDDKSELFEALFVD